MKRPLFVVLAVLLIALGLFIIMYVFNSLKPVEKGALQVTSNLTATVFLNGKSVGKTPLCLCPQNNDTIASGQYDIEIVPDDKSTAPYSTKTNIGPGVLTVVDRTFLPGSLANSSVITLEKTGAQTPELFIDTLPQGAMVLVDGNPVGVTPFSSSSITASEHEIQIERQGFAKKTLRIKTISGYKLVVDAVLGTAQDNSNVNAIPSLTPSPTPTPSVAQKTIVILNTPTGFLRVRSQPSLSGTEVGRVNPGETYLYVSEQNGWYEIKLTNGQTGWVSGEYAKAN